MSLAYKLWKIGSVLDETDVKDVIKTDADFKDGREPSYVNIDFKIIKNEISLVEIKKESISKDKMFFTKKIGGSGSGIYYLYPNLNLQLKEKDSIFSKLPLLVNTIKNSVVCFSDGNNQAISKKILNFLENNSNENVLNELKEIKGGDYWCWISINNKTIYELMPEVWKNWHSNPFIKTEDTKQGYDAFTNKETVVGYKPDFKIFSYDQYHDSHNYRINENLPLSSESAKYIKFAWIFILNKLIFSYNGLEYMIIPNMIAFDREAYKTILDRLIRANKKLDRLRNLRKEEKKLKSDLEKLTKKRVLEQHKISELNNKYETVSKQIKRDDTGFITKFNQHADELGDLKNSVTLDFIFTTIDKKSLSFEVKGSIEDVIPSRLSNLIDIMHSNDYLIEDNTYIASTDFDKTYLRNYFNRDELYFVSNKSHKKNKNRILQEKLYLARLLLTDDKISMDDLLKRFEFHREFDYKHKKRIDKNGIKEWISFPETFTKHENRLTGFFSKINKLKEE